MKTLYDTNRTLGHTFNGTAGDDRMFPHSSAGKVSGRGGNDELHSWGDQRLVGGFGDDTIYFNGGDIARGGRGADTFIIDGEASFTKPARILDFNPDQGDTLTLPHDAALAMSVWSPGTQVTVIDADTVRLDSILIVGFGDASEPGYYVQVDFKGFEIDVADSSQGWQATVEQALYARADGGAGDFIL